MSPSMTPIRSRSAQRARGCARSSVVLPAPGEDIRLTARRPARSRSARLCAAQSGRSRRRCARAPRRARGPSRSRSGRQCRGRGRARRGRRPRGRAVPSSCRWKRPIVRPPPDRARSPGTPRRPPRRRPARRRRRTRTRSRRRSAARARSRGSAAPPATRSTSSTEPASSVPSLTIDQQKVSVSGTTWRSCADRAGGSASTRRRRRVG